MPFLPPVEVWAPVTFCLGKGETTPSGRGAPAPESLRRGTGCSPARSWRRDLEEASGRMGRSHGWRVTYFSVVKKPMSSSRASNLIRHRDSWGVNRVAQMTFGPSRENRLPGKLHWWVTGGFLWAERSSAMSLTWEVRICMSLGPRVVPLVCL